MIEVVRSVGEGGENDDFPVSGIDGMLLFVPDQVQQRLQFGVVLWCDVTDHQGEQLQIVSVFFQIPQPGEVVHICQIDFDLPTHGEIVGVLVIQIKLVGVRKFLQVQNLLTGLVGVDRLNGRLDQLIDPVNGEPEGVDRTLQPFEQIDAHQAPNAFLPALLGQACPLVVGEILIFGKPGGHEVIGGGVD